MRNVSASSASCTTLFDKRHQKPKFSLADSPILVIDRTTSIISRCEKDVRSTNSFELEQQSVRFQISIVMLASRQSLRRCHTRSGRPTIAGPQSHFVCLQSILPGIASPASEMHQKSFRGYGRIPLPPNVHDWQAQEMFSVHICVTLRQKQFLAPVARQVYSGMQSIQLTHANFNY